MEEECPVCYESLKNKLAISIPCSNITHKICLQCFIHLEKKECPLCRASFEHLIPKIADCAKITLVQFINEIPSRE